MSGSIILDPLEMTRICREAIPQGCQSLFASLDTLAARLAALAPATGCLSLMDLNLLQPLIAQEAELRFLTGLLSPAETGQFSRFTYPKRRLEWLGGRLAAKHSLSRLSLARGTQPCFYRDYSLLPDATGRPRLTQPPAGLAEAAVSISHSRGLAGALVVPAPCCGIDIQQKTAQLETVRERFTTPEEVQLLQWVEDPLTRLALLWTAKEAIKKCLLFDQPTFMGAINVTGVTFAASESIWTAQCRVTRPVAAEVTVRIAPFNEYLIACTTGDAHA